MQVIYDMTHAAYLASDGISNSKLKDFGRCPAFYYAKHIAGSVPEVETQAMIDGRRLHAAVLEPEKFFQRHVVAPKCDKRTNAGKETWARFVSENPGKDVVAQNEFDMYRAIGESARRNPRIAALLESGVAEASCFIEDEPTGLPLKARPDWIVEDLICDCKFMRSASAYQFSRDAYTLGYHVQAAFYRYVVARATGREINGFLFVVIEKEPPYLSAVYQADDELLIAGTGLYRSQLDEIARCMATGEWPGYNNGDIVPLSLPAWAAGKVFVDNSF